MLQLRAASARLVGCDAWLVCSGMQRHAIALGCIIPVRLLDRSGHKADGLRPCRCRLLALEKIISLSNEHLLVNMQLAALPSIDLVATGAGCTFAHRYFASVLRQRYVKAGRSFSHYRRQLIGPLAAFSAVHIVRQDRRNKDVRSSASRPTSWRLFVPDCKLLMSCTENIMSCGCIWFHNFP
eukprot:1945336-Pleurochrysis_carterae.AAC.5